ncbi:MAG: hypothetical protein II840_11415 [Kiritimatiellae bacterium]|nr:hypothetical protein [Kiritimatiellia bacterium]
MASDAVKKILPWALAAALLAIVAAVVVCVVAVRGNRERPPADSYDTQYARMHDPAYLKQLEELRQEQKGIARKLVEAQSALEQAKEKGEDSEEFKAAQAKMAAAKDAFQKNRIKAQTLVRDRVMQENDAIKAKQESSKEKGE